MEQDIGLQAEKDNDKVASEQIVFEPETKIKIGVVTYIVAAHFDETRENLPEKIQRLLSSEVKNKIAHLHDPSQRDTIKK